MPQTKHSSHFLRTILTCCIIAIAIIAGFVFIGHRPPMGDEHLHLDQILRFASGNFTMNGAITQIPGYHAMVALSVAATGLRSLIGVRFLSLLISSLSILVFAACARRIGVRNADERTLQYVFIPILFPFFYLLYTDIASVLFVLLALVFAIRRQRLLSGILGIVSVCIRQNNIAWLLFLLIFSVCSDPEMLSVFKHHSKTFTGYARRVCSWKFLRLLIARYWVYVLGFIAFAVFIVLNNGIAIGDKTAHPEFSFHLGNVYFLLFLFFFLFLPFHIANVPAMYRFIRRRIIILPILIALFAFFLFTFVNDHPYNQVQYVYFLRNQVLVLFSTTIWRKALFFLPIAISLLSLAATRMVRPVFVLLYPITFLYLVPSWLIEQRYYFIPLAFFILFRQRQSTLVEWVQIIYSFLWSALLFTGIVQGWFFL